MSDEQTGGSEWELSEAIKLMGEAQASGDPEQIATAMRRHAEALSNATNTIMIPTLKNVLTTVVQKEVGALTLRLEETRIVQDQRFGYMLSQMGASLEKEDARHQVYDESEKTTQAALASVARMLDEITSYVQQGITIAREAHATGKEALAIAKANKVQMATLKKAVVVLEKGQKASKQQWTEIVALLADSKSDRADLRQRINALSTVVEEHNRITAEHAALVHKVAELDARLAALEPHDNVKP